MPERRDKLSSMFGIDIYGMDQTSPPAYYAGNSIYLDRSYVQALNKSKLSKWRDKAMAVFALTHELGHWEDQKGGGPGTNEEQANQYAADNFKRIAEALAFDPYMLVNYLPKVYKSHTKYRSASDWYLKGTGFYK